MMASTVDNRNGNFNNLSENDNGKCYVCKTYCANKCDRCGELYCSIKCQQVDWKTHKYFCFKMPNLIMGEITGFLPTPNLRPNNNKSGNSVNSNSSGNQNGLGNIFRKYHDKTYDKQSEKNSSSSSSSVIIKPQVIAHTDEPKNNEDVVLAWVCKANSYYIRRMESDGEYMRNASDFNQRGRKAKMLQQIPQRNEIVLVRHEKKFVRGLVLNADDRKNINVALVDIGAKTFKTLEDLRECSDDLVERKRHNFKIVLDDVGHSVPPMKWTKLVNFVRNKTIFRLQFDGDSFASGRNFRLFVKTGESAMDVLLKGLVSKTDGHSEVSKPMKETALSVLLKEVTVSKTDGHSEVSKPMKGRFETKSTKPLAKLEESLEAKNTVESRESLEKLEANDRVESTKSLDKSEESLETKGRLESTKSLEQLEDRLETNENQEPKTSTKSLEQFEDRLETNKNQEPKTSTSPTDQKSQIDLTIPTKTFVKDLKFESFQDDVADIVTLDTSAISNGCISVIEFKNMKNLLDLHANVQVIANDLKEEYQPDDNEICLAKFDEDEEWYRALFQKRESMFYLIDYGNYISVERKDLRKLPLSLRDPCWTVSCHIEDFPKTASDEIINEIQPLITNQSFNDCNIKRVIVDGDVEVYITLQIVSDFLQKANN